MIPLAVPNLCGNEAKYLQDCVKSTFVSSVGLYVNRFEQKVAQAAGAKFCVATSSGTTGLHAALHVSGVGRDDLVILPSFTFIASANAISHCGAMPWLFDIHRDSWTLDPDLLKEALNKETVLTKEGLKHKLTNRRVAAIMPVYTLGTPADMAPIIDIARQHALPVVADGAAALGARYRGENLGRLADLTVFSFNGNKTVTAGGGGAVVGNDEAILKLLKHVTTTARVGREYHHDMVGFNYRMTNLQAAVGCAQLEKLEQFVAAKRGIRRFYNSELIKLAGVSPFPEPDWAESACWFSGVILASNSLPAVSEICTQLETAGIQARPFWKPIHLQPPYMGCPRTEQRVSNSIWEKILTLPCSTTLSNGEQIAVMDRLRDILTLNRSRIGGH